MADFLYSLDKSVFYFFNHSLHNSVLDVVMVFVTRTDTLHFRIFYGVVWLSLMVKGGRRGRTVALLLIPVIAASDQLSSSVIKHLVSRMRPCFTLPDVTLLVPCGSGLSFPSSHAVNNFAAATLFSFYYRRWTWAFVTYASIVALSRPYVGVHYPSDALGGAVIGTFVCLVILFFWLFVEKSLARRAEQQPANSA
ncbi:MAG: phosphatase PAP2 family protein [Bacteroidota bacterium]